MPAPCPPPRLVYGHILSPISPKDVTYYIDGALLIDYSGKILAVGSRAGLESDLHGQPYQTERCYQNSWIIPGLVDCHIHYPQARIVAAPATDLLEWLERSIFPAEMAMRRPEEARRVAQTFIQGMLQAGTTSALAYGVTYVEAMDILCEEAECTGIRLQPGKMLMDINAPKALLDPSPETAFEDATSFIARWQGRGNIRPSVALRFALTSTEGLMACASQLLDENPKLLFQTHLNESLSEIAAVKKRFPRAKHYLDVYSRQGLHRPQSVFGHCVHMQDSEIAEIEEVGSAVAHCPCSNLYLDSGLFDFVRMQGVRLGLGSDVAGGYTYSVLENAKIDHILQKLQGRCVSPENLFYYATLGGAKVLGISDLVGSLEPGKQADFIVLSPGEGSNASEMLANVTSPTDLLRQLLMLHQRDHVRATYIDGILRYASP